ncbi:unnamed protein product [Linum tenue]|uniref:Pentatricopeptide repeat-containing protein n=2 Tax=Linum tenue TaxID=586396 RepID=A0AAV0NJG5_9ROSI|nr:unnamed protein product [Linum tenue]
MALSLCRLAVSLPFPRKTRALPRNLHSCTWVLKPHTAGSSAHQLFVQLPIPDTRTATKLIGQLARQKQHREALSLFSEMICRNIRPSEFTFGTVIPLSTAIKDIELGRQFHCCAIRMGLHSVVFVGTALLDFYAKLVSLHEARTAFEDIDHPNVVSYTTLVHGYLKKGSCKEALRLFNRIPERNVVSWNAMIGGLSQMGHNEEAINIFVHMLRQGVTPVESTFPRAIIAASNVAAIGMGKSFHACAFKTNCHLDVFVANSLISFYAKCGDMEDSLLVFDKLPDRNVVSWNAVICGLAQNGRAKDALMFFDRMLASGFNPNDVTLMGVLWACNHAGLVDAGYSHFNQARIRNPSALRPEHYACMVDLLSRCGRFQEAAAFIMSLPFDPGIGFWKALLGGCRIHSNEELGALAARKILALDPGCDVSSYVMLSNAYSSTGKWGEASYVRREMKEKGLTRVSGCSWIEIKGEVRVFTNRDENCKQKDDIYRMLNFLVEQLVMATGQ